MHTNRSLYSLIPIVFFYLAPLQSSDMSRICFSRVCIASIIYRYAPLCRRWIRKAAISSVDWLLSPV
nr:MAG TPA: hypothetical protein [Caudoviricetes sp.]